MRSATSLALLTCGLLLAAAAHALPPGLEHVDPKAPCFRWPAVDMDKDGVFDRVDHCVSTPRGCTVDEYGCSLDGDQDGVCDGLDRCPHTLAGDDVDDEGCSDSDRRARFTPPPTPPPPPPPPPRRERELVERAEIKLERVYFETSSASLLPESEADLREAGEALEQYADLRVEVQGHSDTRGAANYNMRLSQERAESVRAYLLERFRLRPGNLTAKGYGESRPLTRERDDEELRQNRRVVLRVLNPEVLPKNVKVEGER